MPASSGAAVSAKGRSTEGIRTPVSLTPGAIHVGSFARSPSAVRVDNAKSGKMLCRVNNADEQSVTTKRAVKIQRHNARDLRTRTGPREQVAG